MGRLTAGQRKLRVVQLNAGTLLEPDWPARRDEVVAWVDRLDPDVVCLQEVWEDASTVNSAQAVADALARRPWHVAFGGFSFGAELWPDPALRFGSAVLSRWPIDDHEAVRLPVCDGAEPEVTAVPWELLWVTTAGVDVFSTHLAAAPAWAPHRRRQVLAIHDEITRRRGQRDAPPGPGRRRSGMPPILCGDFNAEPDSDEIRFLCSLHVIDGRAAAYQDAWRVAGDGPGWTQDWRTNQLADQMNIFRKRIDYVFVGDPYARKGGAGRVLSAELAFHEPITGISASDHAGLVVDIAWPDRPDAPVRPDR